MLTFYVCVMVIWNTNSFKLALGSNINMKLNFQCISVCKLHSSQDLGFGRGLSWHVLMTLVETDQVVLEKMIKVYEHIFILS